MLACSPALSASQDGTARLWPLAGGEAWSFDHGANVSLAVFSPDGQLLATASDELVRIWKLGDHHAALGVRRGG